eukprot:CAMPEP_0168188680 /NCGR_PEP_ID=MMETSP0139_2-20121125/15846_1 /TAXON_ID=44445 /ORGANISM="Pseudo-nitzschia australis, Strain 10249 10 AB" /LENGTH=165 /DNA_ID=CAMNT_0008111273 /DNA_START=976 /DNA_END=1473 /DNA_ORIENTATION=-
MRDALAAIDGYSFRAAYGTLSEEPEQEPTLPELEPTLPEPGHIKPPPGYSGPPAGWFPSTVDAPVREATMMYSSAPAQQPPTITWATKWPYKDAFPDPLTIELAREHLVEAFRQVACLWTPNAGDHGYAWMAERKANWIVRHGIREDWPVIPPERPIHPPVGCSM